MRLHGRHRCDLSYPILSLYMVSAKQSSASAALTYHRRRARVPPLRRRASSPTMFDAGASPYAALWVQATNIQRVKALIPVTLDLKASNYTRWNNMVQITVTTYAFADHLTTATPPDNDEWLRMDATVLRWLYGSEIGRAHV